ncbi:MAG TPA: isoleucine--tRNA ligase [Candidatus Dormibacteraeota bacterium]|jgi:isoleucyl-tRNA synthetase|nr:isoleucine--tRNA ligase [Candidatus Dormibacteraeota bacterium]
MPRYAPVSSRAAFAENEAHILEFWRQSDVFARSLAQREGAPPYVFYEGPPTANGRPGLHHVLARGFKDLFPRYKQMSGFQVSRKAGWDTHGLPVELEVEKRLKISGKRQIEDYGVDAFNQLCRESVHDYIDDWERMTERLGFWLDMEHPYRTYDSEYIESVWWSLKQIHDRGLLYQDYKVTPYCPRCQTSLSSHELSQGYRDDTPDPSVYVKFRINDSDGRTSLLAWTTTPWTLPGNVALAVHPTETYARVRQGDEDYILAQARLDVLQGPYEVVDTFPGMDLVDLTYEPLFTDMIPEGLAFVVVDAPELVSMSEGTGVVHTAAAYGEADLELCRRKGIAVRHVVGLDGRFLPGQTRYHGIFVKDADKQIIEDLREAGNLYRSETIKHSYPFCWRCETPLLYYALTSWFIRTTEVKRRLIENNRSVSWQPAHIRDGRMGDWLENLVDWNLSRTRYWGTPLPIWICSNEDCREQRAVGSTAELGLTVADDLHKPFIDEVTLPCQKCGGVMRRVPDVIDCWYDSGAMPYAQWHYPFENREWFEERHPADFICEAIDQTRGWFFSLLAESTLLFDTPAYRNVICLGHVVDRSGKKMSKSRGNIIEPNAVFDQFGADAVRWYFFTTVSAGAEYRVSMEAVQEVVRRFLLTLWNTYSFFVTYASIDDFDPAAEAPPVADRPALDRWALARLEETVDEVRSALDAYDATDACRQLEAFVEDCSRWYVRRSRRRFWKGDETGGDGEVLDDADKRSAYATLHTVLLTLSRLLAPFMPFLSERMYRNLSGFEGDNPPRDMPDSVHLTDYPVATDELRDPELLVEMSRLRRLVETGLAAREQAAIKVRQPLRAATVRGGAFSPELEAIFAEELNVKQVEYAQKAGPFEDVVLDTAITDDLLLEGIAREISRAANELRRKAQLNVDDRIVLYVDAEGDASRAVHAHEERLRVDTLAVRIEYGVGEEPLAQSEGRAGGSRYLLGAVRAQR